MGTRVLRTQPDEHHTKAKWYYSYDLYTDNGLGLLVKDDVESFDEFKSRITPILTTPNNLKKTPSEDLDIVGNKISDRSFVATTEEGRRFVRSLITAVQGNMSDGHCFANFNKTNIVLTRTGDVRFKNIAVVPKNRPAKAITYGNTRSLIEELFGQDVPPDLNHLIELMKKQGADKDIEKDKLYAVHPSIAPNMEGSWIFLKMYEVIKRRIPESQRNTIFLKLPYLSDWRTILKQNTVLEETYYHPKGNYSEIHPFDDQGKPVTDNMKKIHEADKFIDFIRNGIAHRSERGILVTPAAYEIIINTSYPLLIPMLQELIFEELGPEGYAKHFGAC